MGLDDPQTALFADFLVAGAIPHHNPVAAVATRPAFAVALRRPLDEHLPDRAHEPVVAALSAQLLVGGKYAGIVSAGDRFSYGERNYSLFQNSSGELFFEVSLSNAMAAADRFCTGSIGCSEDLQRKDRTAVGVLLAEV
jgi:hypothetical protein